jgi:hypothetical protein
MHQEVPCPQAPSQLRVERRSEYVPLAHGDGVCVCGVGGQVRQGDDAGLYGRNMWGANEGIGTWARKLRDGGDDGRLEAVPLASVVVAINTDLFMI